MALNYSISLCFTRGQVDACVGHNYFNFMEFYKVMADNNHSQWVQDGRVQMGTTDFERRLDNMMAYYEGQIRESQQRQKESEQRQKESEQRQKENQEQSEQRQKESEQRQKDLDKTAATAANLANWGRYMREGFEYVAQDVLAEKLKARGYTDLCWLPKQYCKVPYQLDGHWDATEWDGVVTCKCSDKEFLFLLEAKSTSDQGGLLKIPKRIEATLSFINSCVEKSVVATTSRLEQSRNYLWAQYAGLAVRCVLALDRAIGKSSLDLADKHGYITIQPGAGGYDFQDWQK